MTRYVYHNSLALLHGIIYTENLYLEDNFFDGTIPDRFTEFVHLGKIDCMVCTEEQ